MKINGYKIEVICANKWCYEEVGGHPELNKYTYGDISDEYEDIIKMHRLENGDEPEVIFGFYVDGTAKGIETPDWFNTIEEAINWALNN